jgi:hypothetical protein
MRCPLILFAIFSSLIGSLPAEQPGLSGPIEGFTFDSPSESFRPVAGFPGSASLGPAIVGGFSRGSVAPRKDFGLAFNDAQSLFVSGLSSISPSISPLPSLILGQEGIVWSGDGSSAVIYSRSGNWIQTLKGFPDAPAPGALTDLSYLGGALSTIAADSTGKQVAIGIAGDSGRVYLTTDGGDPIPILASAKPVAVAFSDDGTALYVLDGATLQLTAVRLTDRITQTLSLDGLADPIAIKPSRDAANRQVLFVAGRDDHLLRTYDASSLQFLTDTQLDFIPTEINDLGRNSFLLAPRPNDKAPLWVFTTTPKQAVYFIPAAPVPVGGPQ